MLGLVAAGVGALEHAPEVTWELYDVLTAAEDGHGGAGGVSSAETGAGLQFSLDDHDAVTTPARQPTHPTDCPAALSA